MDDDLLHHLTLLLAQIPERFVDDGCSNWFDRIGPWDLSGACRVHDWRGCTRCWPAGWLTVDRMHEANAELGRFIRALLPWGLKWTGMLVFVGVRRFWGDYAFDSCGPAWPYAATDAQLEAGLCRHNMPRSAWMGGS